MADTIPQAKTVVFVVYDVAKGRQIPIEGDISPQGNIVHIRVNSEGIVSQEHGDGSASI